MESKVVRMIYLALRTTHKYTVYLPFDLPCAHWVNKISSFITKPPRHRSK